MTNIRLQSARTLTIAWVASLHVCCHSGPPGASAPLPSAPLPSAQPSRAPAPEKVAVPPASSGQRGATAAGGLGTSHPVVLEAAAADGSWVVLCQARHDTDGDGKVDVWLDARGEPLGDRLESYLFLGSGDGEPIDALLAHDPTGRWLVVQQQQRGLLVDSQSGRRLDLTGLGADIRADRLRYRPHRTLSFDSSGSQLLYLRGQGKTPTVVVRQLESGRETVIHPGPGAVWRAELDAAGIWAVFQVLVQDTNRSGRLDWPVPLSHDNRCSCGGPIPKLDVWPARGDTPVVRVARTADGKVKSVPGFVAPFGNGLLAREPGGRLLLLEAGRQPRQIAPAQCTARVIHADPARKLVVGACSAEAGRPPLVLASPSFYQPLGFEVAPQSHDRWPRGTARLVPLYPGQRVAVLDLQRRMVHWLKPGDSIIATVGRRALVRRGRSLLLFDAGSATMHRLAGRTDPLPDIVRADPIAVASPLVVDVARGQLLGAIDHRPLAVTRTGQVLIAEGGEGDAQRLAVGPLRWLTPSSRDALTSATGRNVPGR